MDFGRSHLLLISLFSLALVLKIESLYSYTLPMSCTDTTRLCTSFLAYKMQPNQTLAVIQSMFDVVPEDVTVEGNGNNYIFIKKNCSCLSTTKNYVSNTTYTVKSYGGYVNDLVKNAYDGLEILDNSTRMARVGAIVSLRLFCGCSSGLWNYVMSYVMKDGDTVQSLASRFGVSMDSIELVNEIMNPNNVTVGDLYYIPLNSVMKDGDTVQSLASRFGVSMDSIELVNEIMNPNNVTVGDLYYIPLNSVPGEPYPVQNNTPPAPAPTPSADSFPARHVNHKSHMLYGWIIGGLGVGFGLIILSIVVCICLRSSSCFKEARGKSGKDPDGKSSHKFHILQKPSFCCGSGRYVCCKSADYKQTTGEASNPPITIPKGLGTDVFDEKPIVFTYDEILITTGGFSDSNLLGHGTYGSVYYGILQNQEVTIKRMTATKTKEFMAEMKILCKVHHTNLVELIGYASTDDELFLIYEYTLKGSLKSHLHDPQNKGHTSLSWIMRVQIALDAARGLEYIHEHTKTHYVHRDIKSSNILLDGAFRAKISDFGLAKLVGKTSDGETTATKVVGTFGYLAPEYLTNGLATARSDVYAFGVVLFEIISGKEAIIRTEGMVTKNHERRSLASVMLAALGNSPDSMSMASLKDYIDPNLMDLYPHDCVFKVAMLAKQCVDEDPILRPDMKQVVISLSQILLSSVEWEATLAGNSQVFSGLVQGR